ncbi:tetratricopeptide repeat protein [Paucibacter soli]|uniref:tetratricopeptide repeat protein n=1 Tax=Paucibacter soli TaxID=3133433 RepID=UPI00309F7D23
MSSAAPTPAARPSARLLLALTLFALLFTAAGYAWLGNPAGLAHVPGRAPEQAGGHGSEAKQFEAMAERLAERLKSRPDDAEGWTMLSRSYAVLGQFDKAVTAYQRVVKLRPDDAQVYADYADALAMANGSKLDGEPETLIKRALELDPGNAKALSLAGTLAFDRGDAASAARHWERALQGMEPGSELAQQLQGALAEARQRAGLSTAGASLQVRVSLAPELAAKAAPDDTLFVFARAAQGSKAPLAIQRRQVKELPLTLTLDDSMAMNPALKLSGAEQVVVGARISKSGNAMPQPGDMQALSAPLKPGAAQVQLQIKDLLP